MNSQQYNMLGTAQVGEASKAQNFRGEKFKIYWNRQSLCFKQLGSILPNPDRFIM